jgi:crotonobetaine/carnitine-CoA ligase
MYFHGRMTDNVRVRGENVSALEVEQVVAKHPASRIAPWSASPPRSASRRSSCSSSAGQGRCSTPRHCRAGSPSGSRPTRNPRYIVMVDEFERTASLRIMKHRLPLAAAAWDRTARR